MNCVVMQLCKIYLLYLRSVLIAKNIIALKRYKKIEISNIFQISQYYNT
jgi:hypothetical protein